MKNPGHNCAWLVLLLALTCSQSACSRHNRDGQPALVRMTCGPTTYRLDADRVDSEVQEACGRVKQSSAALLRYSAAGRVRHTCQRDDGHVVQSLLVSRDLADQYEEACQTYRAAVAAADAEPNAPDASHAKAAALRTLIAETNALTNGFVREANGDYDKNKTEQRTLNQLVKDRGGSIEIPDSKGKASGG
jgi:hypothetical protein